MGRIPGIFIESGKDFAADFSFWMGFLLVKIIFRTIFLWDAIVQIEIRQSKRKSLYSFFAIRPITASPDAAF